MSHRLRSRIVILVALAVVLPAATRAWAAGAGNDTDSEDEQSAALIAMADFNRDGLADIAEIVKPAENQAGPSTLQLLFGLKSGGFRHDARSTALKGVPRALAAGDFNGDGNPDLLVGDADGVVIELLGDGKGHLVSAGEIAHVDSAVSIAVGDFNRDGIPDIAISDFGSNTVSILLGSGHGAFRPAWSFVLPMRGNVYYLAAADFNGDGVSDLAITGDEEGMFVVMLGNGNGTFTYAPNLSHIRDPNSYCPT